MRRGVGFLVLVIVVGAVAGSLLGELLGLAVPHGLAHEIVSRGVSVGIPHFALDLLAIKLSLGLTLRVNLCTVLGLVIAYWVLRK